MSSQYASSFRILPLEVQPGRSGDRDRRAVRDRLGRRALAVCCAREIRRVVANPLDITRYIVEFFSLARTVAARRRAARRNQQQLRAAGRTRPHGEEPRRERPARGHDRRLAAGSTRSTSARATSTGAAPRPRRRALSHRRRAAQRLPGAGRGALGDDQPHQAARPDGRGREAPPAGRTHQDAQRRRHARSSCDCRRLPTAFGEKLVMRIFDPEVLVRDFAELGFCATTIAAAGTR